MTDETKFELVDKLVAQAKMPDAEVNTIDGLRVDYEDGWGLIRASNTTPVLVARFEADTQARLDEIKQQFKALLLQVDSALAVPF